MEPGANDTLIVHAGKAGVDWEGVVVVPTAAGPLHWSTYHQLKLK